MYYCNTFSFSLYLFFFKKHDPLPSWEGPLLSPSSSLSNSALSCWMSEDVCPIKHLPSPHYLLIMKEDFCRVSIVQAGHSSFNAIDIKQEHLINMKEAITLGSMLSLLRPQRAFQLGKVFLLGRKVLDLPQRGGPSYSTASFGPLVFDRRTWIEPRPFKLLLEWALLRLGFFQWRHPLQVCIVI